MNAFVRHYVHAYHALRFVIKAAVSFFLLFFFFFLGSSKQRQKTKVEVKDRFLGGGWKVAALIKVNESKHLNETSALVKERLNGINHQR